MPTERLPMRKVREVLRLKHACGASERLIAQSLGIGRTTGWKPEWASTWPDRSAHAPGVVEWDGLLLTMGAGVRVGRAGARRARRRS